MGPVHLIAEGSTTTVEGEWPSLSYNIVTVAGADNPLPAPIYMVKLDTDNAVYVGSEDKDVTHPDLPGFNLRVLKDSVTFPDGSREGCLSVTPVNSNKVPMPPPNGMQPHGAQFDPPAQLALPNVDGHPPGAEVEMYSYDHDLEEFVTIGIGTVSKDGALIASNKGTGVIKAGWHCGSPPGGSGCCSSENGGCGECKDWVGNGCDGRCIFNGAKKRKNQIEDNCRTELCAGHKVDDSDEPEEKCIICIEGIINATEGNWHGNDYDKLIEFCPHREHDKTLNHEFDGCTFSPDSLSSWNTLFGGTIGPSLYLGIQKTKFGERLGSVPYEQAQNQTLPCNLHDLCWQTCGSNQEKCNTAFGDRIENACNMAFSEPCPYSTPVLCELYNRQRMSCSVLGERYRIGAKLGGIADDPLERFNFYKNNQTRYCSCCEPDSGS